MKNDETIVSISYELKLDEINLSTVTKENFTEYYLDKFAIRDNKETKFREEINHKWNDISFAIETISKSEKIFVNFY